MAIQGNDTFDRWHAHGALRLESGTGRSADGKQAARSLSLRETEAMIRCDSEIIVVNPESRPAGATPRRLFHGPAPAPDECSPRRDCCRRAAAAPDSFGG